mgnify:CR=1 FL=1
MRKSTISLVNQTNGTLSHWFMPYKVEGGKSYFQYGTKEFKARQGKAIKPKSQNQSQKILEYLQ